jgi:DUF4097 and DUF4098 domain-containing protein YvlB
MVARRNTLGAVACFVLLLASGCDMASDDGDAPNKLNGSIHVAAGKAATDVKTVNGSISIDDNGTVDAASTVNGNIKLGAHATATSLHTVNGRITLGDGAQASEASTVNGDLTLGEGADLAGRLANVNGKISLTDAHVGGGIKTTNGDISIWGGSHVEGGLEVDEVSGTAFNSDPLITIGPGASVQGGLVFKRKVRLFVSDRATIGTITGATAVPFSGDKPPRP